MKNRFSEQLKEALAPEGKIAPLRWGKIFPAIGVGTVITFAGIYLSSHFMAGEPLPPSLDAAGFVDGESVWPDNKLRLAVKITHQTLKNGEAILLEADKRGDAAAVVPLFDLASKTLRTWSGQPSGAPGGSYRDCVLAAVHLGDGAQSVWQGGHYINKDRFRAALNGCDV